MTSRSFLLKMVSACAAIACCAGFAMSEDVTLTLQTSKEGSYALEGRFAVPASKRVAWDTLADYDGVEDFVSSIRSSRLVERSQDSFLIEQEARAKVLFFSRDIHVLLRIHERPYREIRFEDVSGKDFKSYSGTWELEESQGVVTVVYKLKAKRRFHAPDFLAQSAFQKNAKTMLEEVRQEILRRAASLK